MEEWKKRAKEQKKQLGGHKVKLDIWTTKKNKNAIENAKEDDYLGVSIFLSRILGGMNYTATTHGAKRAEELGSLVLALLEGDFEGAIIMGDMDEKMLGGIDEKKVTVH